MKDRTPHTHWSAYDENNEMAWFDALHAKLLAGDKAIDAEVAELGALATSYGYGEADSHLTDFGKSRDTPYEQACQESYENYMEGDYWNLIDTSENVLRDALGSDVSALALVRAACQGMRDGFEAGRASREALQVSAPSM